MDTATAIFMVILGMLAVTFDFCAAYTRGIEYTISAQVWKISKTYPIIPFGSGLLMGHFFWSQN